MKYKKYFRKSSIKNITEGNLFLKEINKINPKTFFEIGIFQGVLAKNVCDLMFNNHGLNFKYYGVDIFETDEIYKNEIPPSLKINNPLKRLYFKYIKKYNPYSIEAVEDLLKDYKNNIKLIKGNSNTALKDTNIKNIDLILSPAIGGIVIGYEIGRILNIETIFAERVEGNFNLRRGFEISKGQKILIVEDVITTGKSSLECSNLVKKENCSNNYR